MQPDISITQPGVFERACVEIAFFEKNVLQAGCIHHGADPCASSQFGIAQICAGKIGAVELAVGNDAFSQVRTAEIATTKIEFGIHIGKAQAAQIHAWEILASFLEFCDELLLAKNLPVRHLLIVRIVLRHVRV